MAVDSPIEIERHFLRDLGADDVAVPQGDSTRDHGAIVPAPSAAASGLSRDS